MKWMRKHQWVNLCFLVIMLFSGLGSDYIQGSSLSTDFVSPAGTFLSSENCAQHSRDICSSDQLGGTSLQRNSGELKLEMGRSSKVTARTSFLSAFAVQPVLYFTYFTAALVLFYQSSTHQLMVFMNYIHRQDGEKSSLCVFPDTF